MTAHSTQPSQQADAAATLVVEIVTEELPPKSLKALGASKLQALPHSTVLAATQVMVGTV